MKLIAEQVKYLRQRKRELEAAQANYRNYAQTRESGGMDGFGGPHYLDFQEQNELNYGRQELSEIERALANAQFVTDRNFEMIDIGTAFFVDFGEGDNERTMLIDANTTSVGATGFYASTASDFGSAVYGKKVGDKVDYTVKANGRKMSVTITGIDHIKENYTRFLRERSRSKRMAESLRSWDAIEKEVNPKSYHMNHAITPSQKALLKQEISKLGYKPRTQSGIMRKANIQRILDEDNMAVLEDGNHIQPGSFVTIMVMEENGETKEYSFEYINEAVSTEIEGEYVERISPLGQAIYGLEPGESFKAKRNHKPDIKGMVLTVDNTKGFERVK